MVTTCAGNVRVVLQYQLPVKSAAKPWNLGIAFCVAVPAPTDHGGLIGPRSRGEVTSPPRNGIAEIKPSACTLSRLTANGQRGGASVRPRLSASVLMLGFRPL